MGRLDYTVGQPIQDSAVLGGMEMNERSAAIVVMIGGGLIALGSFLPWITVRTGFGSLSRSGLEGGDGILTLILGLGLVVAGYLLLNASTIASWIIPGAAAIVGIVGFINLRDVQERVDDAGSEFVAASVGTGLYAILIGAIAAFAAGMGWLGNKAVAPTSEESVGS